MEQHPVPQQISSYEFRLVGDMTLKQFGKLAAGIILALLVNSAGFPAFVRWPLVLLFGGGGAALAFLPIQERPLETWIVAYFKTIYSPTIHIWSKTKNKDWLRTGNLEKENDEEKEEEERVYWDKGEKLDEFLETIPDEETPDARFLQGWGMGLKEKIKSLTGTEKNDKKEDKKKDDEEELRLQAMTSRKGQRVTRPEVQLREEVEKNSDEITGRKVQEEPYDSDWYKKAELGLKSKGEGAAIAAEFGKIPMPKAPDIPNTIAGMVTDSRGKMVEDAIVEIQDRDDHPVRALRTNSLGQFQTATPLASGPYLIIVEKEGLSFAIMKIELEGKIIPPIRIEAKGELN